MKHYAIFGRSLPAGIQKIGRVDIGVHTAGILLYILYSSSLWTGTQFPGNDIDHLFENSTELNPFDWIGTGTNETCIWSDKDDTTIWCILESSAGVIGMLVHILELLLAILVMKIGKQLNIDKCTLWIRVTAVLSTIEALVVIATQLIHTNPKLLVPILLNTVYKYYSASLVHAYTSEKKKHLDRSKGPSASPVSTSTSTLT